MLKLNLENFPIPNEELVFMVSGKKDTKRFLEHRNIWPKVFTEHNLLPYKAKVLDLGCGCSRIAGCMVEFPFESYVGLDVDDRHTQWNLQYVTPHDSRYKYVTLPYFHPYYNPQGEERLNLLTSQLPYEDESFDLICCAGLFVHLLMKETMWYFKEVQRLLKPKGTFLTTFWMEDVNTLVSTEDVAKQPVKHDRNLVCLLFNMAELKIYLEDPDIDIPFNSLFLARRLIS